MGQRRTAGTSGCQSASQQDQQQQGSSELAEVLDLVISVTLDASLLCKSTVVSSYFRDLALTQVRDNLPQLLVHAIRQAAAVKESTSIAEEPCLPPLPCAWADDTGHTTTQQTRKHQKAATMAIYWLCKTAGPAASHPQVAAALLSKDMVVEHPFSLSGPHAHTERPIRGWVWEQLSDVLQGADVKLSEPVVAAAAKQQLPPAAPLWHGLVYHGQEFTKSNQLYDAVVTNRQYKVQQLLQRLKPSASRLLDLLFIACSTNCAGSCAELLDYDTNHTKNLTARTVAAAAASAAGGGDIVASSSSRRSRRGRSAQQQQQQGKDPRVVVEQLMLTCLSARALKALGHLVRHVPAAAALGAASVTKLMQTAALLGNKAVHNPEVFGAAAYESPLDVLCELPAAKDVSTSAIISVVRALLHRGAHKSRLHRLLALPGALSMTSTQICDLLLLAIRKRAKGITRNVARLASYSNIESNDVKQVLLTASKELSTDRVVDALEWICCMKPWHHLSAEDCMQLLVKIAPNTSGCDALELFTDAMRALKYRSKPITDTASFVRFLKALVKHGNCEVFDYQIRAVLKAANAPTLDAQQYLELLRECVVQKLLPDSIAQLPSAKGVSVKELWQLMQLCFNMQPVSPPSHSNDSDSSSETDEGWYGTRGVLEDLAKFPAAQQLSAKQILQLVQQAVKANDSWPPKLCASLLALPAAVQISAAGARELLSAAFDCGAMDAVENLCQRLPACAAAWECMDPAVLQQQLQKALTGEGHSTLPGLPGFALRSGAGSSAAVCSLLKHPRLQQYAAEVLPMVLLAGFRNSKAETSAFNSWGVYGLPKRAYRSLLDDQGAGFKLQLSHSELRALLRLPAAAQLSAATVQQLLHASIEHMAGALLEDLLALPGAAEIDDCDVAALLRLAMRQGSSRARGTAAAAVAATGAVAAGPASGAATAAAAVAEAMEGAAAPGNAQEGIQRSTQLEQKTQRKGRHPLPQFAQQQQQQQQQDAQARRRVRPSLVQPDDQQQQQQQADLGALALSLVATPRGCAVLFPLLQLPWARQLPAAVVCSLLQSAAERQARSTFDHLMQLPQAPRGDAQVQGWADALRFSTGDASLVDYAPPGRDGDDVAADDLDAGFETPHDSDEPHHHWGPSDDSSGGGSDSDSGSDSESEGDGDDDGEDGGEGEEEASEGIEPGLELLLGDEPDHEADDEDEDEDEDFELCLW